MEILSIVGARPQFVKVATIARAAEGRDGVVQKILHTGQHYDASMSGDFFKEMDIPRPDYHLEVNQRTHGGMTGQMMIEIERILQSERPDVVLLYGDTNSTLAGALAASKIHIPIGHVEAGLRSFNMKMPEEINRIGTDRLSNFLFCPTKNAVLQLKREGFTHPHYSIHELGDVMLDAVRHYERKAVFPNGIESNGKPILLVTVHRPSNTDHPLRLKKIVEELNQLSQEYQLVFPAHPRTQAKLLDFGLTLDFKPFAPLSYFEILGVLQMCTAVLTDSGGLQKEAFFMQKPCLTLRTETEWVELIEEGYNSLVNIEGESLIDAVDEMLNKKTLDFSQHLYGDGNAAGKILDVLLDAGPNVGSPN